MEVTNASQLLALLGPCPACGGGHLQVVGGAEGNSVLCTDCATCWRTEVEWIARVDPATCPGCSMRALCTAHAAAASAEAR